VRDVARIGTKESVCGVMVGKSEEKRRLWRPRCGLEDMLLIGNKTGVWR